MVTDVSASGPAVARRGRDRVSQSAISSSRSACWIGDRTPCARVVEARRAHGIDGRQLRIGQPRRAQRARRLLGLVQPIFEERGASFDRRRRVVQLVGEPGGQLAERHHLLVVQTARREQPGAVEHLVHEDCRDLVDTRGSSGRSARGTARISDRLLRHRVARRTDQARVRQHAGDVTGLPLHRLCSARRRGRCRSRSRPISTTNMPATGTSFALSTSPSFSWRSVPCAASHASSSRGAVPTVLCAASRSTRSLAVTWWLLIGRGGSEECYLT